jgi:hypothetical protein
MEHQSNGALPTSLFLIAFELGKYQILPILFTQTTNGHILILLPTNRTEQGIST